MPYARVAFFLGRAGLNAVWKDGIFFGEQI
jgi:hypothetical protein